MEPYKTRAEDWRSDLSFNTYVPISVADALRLYTFDDVLALYTKETAPITKGNQTLFFGNHPLRFVQISGYVLNVVYTDFYSTFCVVDHTSSMPLICFSKTAQFQQHTPVVNGQLVVVWGGTAVLDFPTIEVHQLFVFEPNEAKVFYMLRQQALLTRKLFLEWPADAFEYLLEPLAVGVRPKTSLVAHAKEISSLHSDLLKAELKLKLEPNWFDLRCTHRWPPRAS